MSLDDLKRNIERSIVRRQVLSRELEAKATVNEAEARAEYERNKAAHTRRASVHLHEIVVARTRSRPGPWWPAPAPARTSRRWPARTPPRPAAPPAATSGSCTAGR